MFLRLYDNKDSSILIVGVGETGENIISNLQRTKIKYHTCVVTIWPLCHVTSADTILLLKERKQKNAVFSNRNTEKSIKLYYMHKDELEYMLIHHSTTKKVLIITALLEQSEYMLSIIPKLIKTYKENYKKSNNIYVVLGNTYPFNMYINDIFFEKVEIDNNTLKVINILKEYEKKGIIKKLILIDKINSGRKVNYIDFLNEEYNLIAKEIKNIIKKIDNGE